jgi:hypothetical protein
MVIDFRGRFAVSSLIGCCGESVVEAAAGVGVYCNTAWLW